ncbi:MAG: glycosyltransferase [Candidatus Paceibacterota bacterium]
MKKVSIIMPTYNGSKWIKRAIDSIKAQSYTDWELLVVDDGSTDDTGSIIKDLALNDHRIRYIKNDQNMGIQKTLNRGLREALGVYIARIDDDDIWCDIEKLAKQVEFLDKNPEYSLVGTNVILIDEKGNEISKSNRESSDLNIRKIILSKNPFAHSSVVFIRDAVISIGGILSLEFLNILKIMNCGLELAHLINLPICKSMERIYLFAVKVLVL